MRDDSTGLRSSNRRAYERRLRRTREGDFIEAYLPPPGDVRLEGGGRFSAEHVIKVGRWVDGGV